MSGPPPPPQYAAPPPPTKSHAGAYAAIAVVAVLAVLGGVGLVLYQHSGPGGSNPLNPVTVTVTQVEWTATGCGFTSTTGSGFTGSGGTTETVSVTFHYNGFLGFGSCDVNGVSVQTPGFQLVSDNAPFVIDGGTSGTLTVTVGLPNANYDGPLDLAAQLS